MSWMSPMASSGGTGRVILVHVERRHRSSPPTRFGWRFLEHGVPRPHRRQLLPVSQDDSCSARSGGMFDADPRDLPARPCSSRAGGHAHPASAWVAHAARHRGGCPVEHALRQGVCTERRDCDALAGATRSSAFAAEERSAQTLRTSGTPYSTNRPTAVLGDVANVRSGRRCGLLTVTGSASSSLMAPGDAARRSAATTDGGR